MARDAGDGVVNGVLLVVAAALVDDAGRVLLARRPPGKSMAGLWEFPGGKVDPGETPEAAIVREMREELSVEIDPVDLEPATFASHAYPAFHLLMPIWLCRRWAGRIRPLEGQETAWVEPGRFGDYPMPPADVAPAEILRRLLTTPVRR